MSYVKLSRKYARSLFLCCAGFLLKMNESSDWSLSRWHYICVNHDNVMSWLLRPGHDMHLFSKKERFVMKTSKVLIPWVGKYTKPTNPSNVKYGVNKGNVDICSVILGSSADRLQVNIRQIGITSNTLTKAWYLLARSLRSLELSTTHLCILPCCFVVDIVNQWSIGLYCAYRWL